MIKCCKSFWIWVCAKSWIYMHALTWDIASKCNSNKIWWFDTKMKTWHINTSSVYHHQKSKDLLFAQWQGIHDWTNTHWCRFVLTWQCTQIQYLHMQTVMHVENGWPIPDMKCLLTSLQWLCLTKAALILFSPNTAFMHRYKALFSTGL